MKKSNTCPKSSRRSKTRKRLITIGMDLGDKTSHYYVMDSEDEMVREGAVATTPVSRRPKGTSTRTFSTTVSSHIYAEPFGVRTFLSMDLKKRATRRGCLWSRPDPRNPAPHLFSPVNATGMPVPCRSNNLAQISEPHPPVQDFADFGRICHQYWRVS